MEMKMEMGRMMSSEMDGRQAGSARDEMRGKC